MKAGLLMITFDVVKKHPGLTLDELAEKIGQEYTNAKADSLLSKKIYEHDFLIMSLEEIPSLEERDGRYYFNSKIKPYSTDAFANGYIEEKIKSERKTN